MATFWDTLYNVNNIRELHKTQLNKQVSAAAHGPARRAAS